MPDMKAANGSPLVPLEMDPEAGSEHESTDEGDVPEEPTITDATFVEIEGITPDDISEADKEGLRKQIVDYMLVRGYGVTAVDILEDGVIVSDAE